MTEHLCFFYWLADLTTAWLKGHKSETCYCHHCRCCLFTNCKHFVDKLQTPNHCTTFTCQQISYLLSGMGIVKKNHKFLKQLNKFCEEKKMGGKEIGDTGFSSALNTCKTYGVHSHTALACVSHFIVNIAAGCYSHGIRLEHIFTHFCHVLAEKKQMFWKWKTMMVIRVVNCGEMCDDCGCANEWEWVSVNISWIGLVSRRHEKPVGLCTCGLFYFVTAAQPQTMTYSSIWWRKPLYRRIPAEQEVKAYKKWLGFLMLQLEILISYIAGPNFWFSCDERGVRVGVGVAIRHLKSWSVGASLGHHWLNLFP